MYLYLADIARCVSNAACCFGRPSGVAYFINIDHGYYVCIQRQSALKKFPSYYIGIDLWVTKSNSCTKQATLMGGRICACPEHTYFAGYDGDAIRCTDLPPSFDCTQLRLDIGYTYDGEERVQHHRLVTYEECTPGSIDYPPVSLHGRVSLDGERCVMGCPPG